MHISELFSVSGKTAVVTGGSRGIGEMIAAGFLANGAKVYISSRKSDACAATAARLTDQWGGECIAVPADLSGPDGAEELAQGIADREDRVDVLVNNAGQAWGAPFAEFPEKGWDRVMNVNVKGPFYVIQRMMPLLEAAASADDPARIINIGSIDGIRPPRLQTYSYSPSKAALHAMTRQLAAEFAPRHVLVNAIAPGPFPTWMLSTGVGGGGDVENTDWNAIARANPRGRVGTPEDIAGLAIFLASRAGAYTVGEIITCDGGIVVG